MALASWLLLVIPSVVAAQQPEAGAWRAELVTPAGDTVTFVMQVEHPRSRLRLTARAPGAPDVVMGGARFRRGHELSFTWAAGGNAFYFCRLTRRDDGGLFDGTCEDNRVSVGTGPVRALLTLSPPR